MSALTAGGDRHASPSDDHGAQRSGTCANCGAAAVARFCPECGQSTRLHPPTVREFVHEFITHSIALEGALWRTLVALLMRPGRLTADYFAGRRARYIAPLRLYLTFSLIFFAVNGLNDGDLAFGNQTFRFSTESPNDAKLVIGPRSATQMHTGIAAIDDAFERLERMTPAERDRRIHDGMKRDLPYALIVLVPVLALYLKVLYRSRRRLYGEHLVVAFHAQTAALVFALVSAIPAGEIYGLAVLVLFVVQATIALRTVYGGSFASTLLREAALFAAYAITASTALVAIVFFILLLSH